MGRLIDDEVLNTFAVVGEPEGIAPELGRRYGEMIEQDLVLRAARTGYGLVGDDGRRRCECCRGTWSEQRSLDRR